MEVYDQLCKARWLIGQRRYAEARSLLKTISHAQATEWLARLDEIEQLPFADHGVPLKRFARQTSEWRCWRLPLGIDPRTALWMCGGVIVAVAVILTLL